MPLLLTSPVLQQPELNLITEPVQRAGLHLLMLSIMMVCQYGILSQCSQTVELPHRRMHFLKFNSKVARSTSSCLSAA
jgi:hypothetical protein